MKHATTLISIPANPVPDDAVCGMITTSDGVNLRFARWPVLRSAGPCRGTVCIFTGRGEYIEKYFETVRDLRDRGFAVAALDWRGQGHSARGLRDARKGYVRRFSDFELDVEAFVREIVLPDCPPPHFAMAHSMGGAVMLRVAHGGRRWFDRFILCAPMIDLSARLTAWPSRVALRTLRWMGSGGAYVPGGTSTLVGCDPFPGNPLTSDPVRYARNAAIMAEDPTLGIAAPTVAWADTAFHAMHGFKAETYPSEINQPVLIIAAGQDNVVSTPAIERFATQMRSGAHLVVPGAQHEILQEQDRYRAQFWAAFDAFVPGTPAYK